MCITDIISVKNFIITLCRVYFELRLIFKVNSKRRKHKNDQSTRIRVKLTSFKV